MSSVWFPHVPPDGSRLLTYNANGTYIWRFDRKRFEPLPRVDAQHVFMNSSWSPDGRSVVGLSNRANDVRKTDAVVVYSFQTNQFEKISNDTPRFDPIWLPDGKRVIYASDDRVVAVDLATKQRREITPPIAGLDRCAVSPDGRALYLHTSRTEGDVWLITERQDK